MRNSHQGLRDLFGAWAVLSIVQIFLAEPLVTAAWRGSAPYSPILDVISDLGAAHCGMIRGRDVCSPLHALMDGSFILQGVGMILGGLLMGTLLLSVGGHPEGPHSPQAKAARWVRALLVVSGAGALIVGLAPEDVLAGLHYTGATVFFVAGCITLYLLFAIWHGRSPAAWALLACAVVASVATVVYTLFGIILAYPGFFSGLAERLIVYPVVIGFIITGATIALGVRRHKAVQARLAI